MEDFKKLLTDLYNAYEPERVKQIDYFLEKYKGKEKEFYTRQKENYEKKKPVSDSNQIIEEALSRIKSRATESNVEPEKVAASPIERPSKPIEDKKEFAPPKPIPEKKFVFPVAEDPIERKIEDSAVRDSFFDKKSEHGIYNKSTPPPPPQTKDDIWSDENKVHQQSNTQHIETEIRIKKKYFLSILGMVLLATTLIMIVYFIFFGKSQNQATGIVQKPAGMITEKPVDQDKTTILDAKSIAEKKEAAQKTGEPEAKITEQKPSAAIATDEKPVVEKKKTTQDSGINKKETSQEKPSTSIWAKLFPKKKMTVQQTGKAEAKTSEPKLATTTTDQKPITITEKPIEEKKEIVSQATDPPAKTISVTSGVRFEKGSLNLPVYFVACYAVKTETHAIKKVNELKAKGFDASYYWIPDFTPQGNQYFKVVIGPFNTLKDTYIKLTPVQERAEFDAYVLQLK